ncbi:MAG: cytochrome P450 [Rhodobacteraceae bacterium]|nr:cytochrome P450 [Paracoccaceae bacterium]
MIPPKPPARPRKTSLIAYLRLFRRDILSAQPAHLFSAWMAEFKTPFFRSILANDPTILRTVLQERPEDFPKSDRIGEGLRPLLGQSVFITNGTLWARQRRIIDPAFEGGRIAETLPVILAASDAATRRMRPGQLDAEEAMSHATADVIFRALFSVPIEDQTASALYDAFRRYQRAQPLVNFGAFIPLPKWVPRGVPRAARLAARDIRALIMRLVDARAAQIEAGTAPDDLATRIMTTPDPETGAVFAPSEMVDQVAIFLLAGHETSAAALSWALWLLAANPELQEALVAEAQGFVVDPKARTSPRKTLPGILDVVRETLRLYPPVPMMVRETTAGERFRDRDIPEGTQVVLSPWHLHRHTRLWTDPDEFDPSRWGNDHPAQRDAYMPFSKGPRTCPGAAFALTEACVILAYVLARFRLEPATGAPPDPVAHLTLRARSGIRVILTPRPLEDT